jgi:hypothetical protein
MIDRRQSGLGVPSLVHQPPIGDCLHKKWFDLFCPFANVSLKHT